MPTANNLLCLILSFADGKQFLELNQVSLFFPKEKKHSAKYSQSLSLESGKEENLRKERAAILYLTSIHHFLLKSYVFTVISNGCQHQVFTHYVIFD